MPTGTVQFLDGSTPLGTEPLQGGSAVLTTSTLVTGAHSITAAYSGDVNFNPRTSSPLTQVIEGPPDFAMTISPAGTTISAGNLANFTVKVAPQNAFVGTVTLSCSWTNTPSGTSCQLSPSSLTISSDGTAGASTLTVYTAGSMASTNFDRSWPSRLVYAVFCFGLAPVGFVWSTVSSQRQMTFFSFCLVALLAGILLFEVACGGGGGGQVNPQTGTPTGAYSVVVTATTSGSSGAIQHSSTVTVTVQ